MPRTKQPAAATEAKVEAKETTVPAAATEAKVEVLSLGEKLRRDMLDNDSDLRNQTNKENTRDFQLLSNTPASIISAMTGFSLQELDIRAKELNTTLKSGAAGDWSNKPSV